MSSLARTFRRQLNKHRGPPVAVPLAEPRMNKWSCQRCTWSVVTIEHVEGVTPFAIPCGHCSGSAFSAFYAKQEYPSPTREWRMPTAAEYRRLGTDAKDHVDRGGLLDYPIAESKPAVEPGIFNTTIATIENHKEASC